jgi:hypothetical protein
MVKLRKYLPDWKFKVKDVFGENDRVCIQYELSGTFSGEPFFSVKPTNKRATGLGTMILTFKNFLVVSEFLAFDDLHFFSTLGIPPLTETGELNIQTLRQISKYQHEGNFNPILGLLSDECKGIFIGRGLKGEGYLKGKEFLNIMNLNSSEFMKAEYVNKKYIVSSDSRIITTISTEMVGGQPKYEWNSVWEFDQDHKLLRYRAVAADCSGMSVA